MVVMHSIDCGVSIGRHRARFDAELFGVSMPLLTEAIISQAPAHTFEHQVASGKKHFNRHTFCLSLNGCPSF